MTGYVVEQRIGATWIGVSRAFPLREQAERYLRSLPRDKDYRIAYLQLVRPALEGAG